MTQNFMTNRMMISMIDFDKPMTDLFSPTFLDFKFSNLNYHLTLRRWTLISRFLRVISWGLSGKKVEKNFWIFYKISDLSRFPAIVIMTWELKWPTGNGASTRSFKLTRYHIDPFKSKKESVSQVLGRWINSLWRSYHYDSHYLPTKKTRNKNRNISRTIRKTE